MIIYASIPHAVVANQIVDLIISAADPSGIKLVSVIIIHADLDRPSNATAAVFRAGQSNQATGRGSAGRPGSRGSAGRPSSPVVGIDSAHGFFQPQLSKLCADAGLERTVAQLHRLIADRKITRQRNSEHCYEA